MTQDALSAAPADVGKGAGTGADVSVDDAPHPTLLAVGALAFVLAACSLLYELIAAQTLSLLAADTVVWYSLVVGVFLASMGIGALWSRRTGRVSEWRTLFRIEVALAFAGAVAVPVLRLGHTAYSYMETLGRPGPGLFAFLGSAFLVVAAIGFLTGIELPILMRIGRLVRDESRSANLVLGLDYIGSLAGALLFPLVVLPSMGLVAAGLTVALVNLTAAVWVLTVPLGRSARGRDGIVVGTCAALILAGIANGDRIEQYLLRRFYYRALLGTTWAERYAPRGDLPRVLHARSPYQNIDLVRDPQPDFMSILMPAYSGKLQAEPSFPVDRVLFLNGDFQTNTRYEEIYHEWFAHVPVVANGKVPRNVLVLGGGDGLLLRELVKYPGIGRIRHVDLDPVLVTLAKTDPVLHAANRDSFRDPRVEQTFEDGYQFVRRSTERFDAVYVDFPAAVNYDLAKLYSREFFEFVRHRIAPGGYVVFDATGTSFLTARNDRDERWITPENDWPIYYATVRAAGYETIVPYLTTLEIDNPEARKVLAKFKLDAAVQGDLAALPEEERERRRAELREGAIRQYMEIHSLQLEQGFIVAFPEEREIHREYTDPGVPLYVLDAERYRHSFDVPFPTTDDLDRSKVNSILRPTMPTQPWWLPRLGY